jgi:uncharacterized protein
MEDKLTLVISDAFVRAGSGAPMSIWAAARRGDVGEVERLVGQDPSRLDDPEKGGLTPLMWASFCGHVEVVRSLLDKGAAVNKQSTGCLGCTALFFASGGGRTPVVRVLVGRGADPSIVTDDGTSPLIAACGGGHLETVRCLLAHASAAATINRRDDAGKTALWQACDRGYGDVVRVLLQAGADPTIADKDGITPRAIAEERPRYLYQASHRREGRRRCVVALKVSRSGV